MTQKRKPPLLSNQNGSVILIVMLVLVTVIALSATMINFSTSDIDMAGNYKFDKIAFYSGDSGIYATPKFIRLVFPSGDPISEESPAQAGCVRYLNTTQTDSALEILQRIYGFEGRDATGSYNDSVENEMDSQAGDISMRGCDVPADINVIPLGGEQLSGGGVEFGSGGDGVGGGTIRSVKFRLVSTGHDDSDNSHTIRAIYRWVDVPGGL